MNATTIMKGHIAYIEMLNSRKIENGLGGEMRKAKQKKANTHHWSMKGLKPGMKRPVMFKMEGRFHDFTRGF